MKSLSELMIESRNISPPNGEENGTCIFCGSECENGHPAKLKANFTGYSYLQSGNLICPACFYLYNEQEYRKHMWVASSDGYRTFKRDEGKNILLHPPNIPFAIYFTRTWKKQGWIAIMEKVNYDRDRFYVGFDYDVILIDRIKVREYLNLIESLLSKKISKSELATGQLKPRSLEKIDMDVDLFHRIQTLAGENLWQLCVYVSEGEKKND